MEARHVLVANMIEAPRMDESEGDILDAEDLLWSS